MTILYFTATGNCLDVAKRIGGDDAGLLSIPQMVKEGKYSFKDDAIGIIFPVFYCDIPDYIRNFLAKVRIDCEYMFVIATFGEGSGSISDEVQKLMDHRSIPVHYINYFQMTDNYIPEFEMNAQIQQSAAKNIDGQIQKVCDDIAARRHWIITDHPMMKEITARKKDMLRKWARDMGVNEGEPYDLRFFANDTCIHCATCVKVCPLGNISLDSKPIWHHNCIGCLACIQNCPKGSIHLPAEKSGTRFRNNNVSLREIIESNNQK